MKTNGKLVVMICLDIRRFYIQGTYNLFQNRHTFKKIHHYYPTCASTNIGIQVTPKIITHLNPFQTPALFTVLTFRKKHTS